MYKLRYDNKTWRLPTINELTSFASYSINKGSSGIMLCGYEQGYGSARCDHNEGACTGGHNDYCYPHTLYSSNLDGGSNTYGCYLGKNSWARVSNSRNYPQSVRCVTELE